MALPSQTPRPQSARGFRSAPSKGRPPVRLIVGLLLIGGVVAAGVIFNPWTSEDRDPDQANAAKPAANEESPVRNHSGTNARQPDVEKPRLPLGDAAKTPERSGQPNRGAADAGTPAREPGSLTMGDRPASKPADPKPEPPVEPKPEHDSTIGGKEAPAPTMPQAQPTKPDQPRQPERSAAQSYIDQLFEQAKAAQARNRPLDARDLLNRALHDARTPRERLTEVRQRLAELNETLVFSPLVVSGDPLSSEYAIQKGDGLEKIVKAQNLNVEWGLLARVNRLADPGRIQPGQKIKLVKGPFHAVVTKSAFRMDIYADAVDGDGNRLYIRSFPVGLGEFDSTPVGKWVVKNDTKLRNPNWTNPRTSESFDKDDPKNPIGERWIALTGTDANTQTKTGYGIHGTIDPGSIGKEMSMGCIRCLPADIELVYDLFGPTSSTAKNTVEIVE